MSFFEELKRRNVFRVGIAYLIAAWLILQVVDIIAPILDLPEAFSKGVLLLLAIGLPIAVVLAWVYEMTPEGVKKERDVDRSESITGHTGRKLDFVIIGVLTVAVVAFALDKFVLDDEPDTMPIASTEQQAIAVLPFINMSSDEEQEYFSDGLTEELLNLLARVPQLRVTSRSSAFYYKGKDYRIADVGQELGVKHVLEGSVRRSGDTVRITAQLINVPEDSHVWSETWDRTFDDIFLIQDEIAQAVVDELQIRLAGAIPQIASTDPEAYSLYLRAQHLLVERTVINTETAMGLLQEALEIDREFVSAWLVLGDIYWSAIGIGMFDRDDATSRAREAANNVLRIDPENGRAHMLLAQVAGSGEADVATALQEGQLAAELSPNDSEVLRNLAFHTARTGAVERAWELYQQANSLDPIGVANLYGYALGAMAVGQFDEAENALRKAIELAPDGVGYHQRLAWILLIKGKYEEALAEADKEVVEARRASVRALIFQTMGDTEQARTEHERLITFGERWTYEIARLFAFRGLADEAFDWLDRSFARADGSLWFVAWDPFIDSIRDDPRFASVEERLHINSE